MSPFFYFPAETSPAAVRPYGCLSSLKLDRLSHGAGMSLKRLRVLHPVDLTALADDDLFSPNDLGCGILQLHPVTFDRRSLQARGAVDGKTKDANSVAISLYNNGAAADISNAGKASGADFHRLRIQQARNVRLTTEPDILRLQVALNLTGPGSA